MATNFVQQGDLQTVVAPYASVAGRYVVVNSTTFYGGVAQSNADSAANVVIRVGGVHQFSKPNAVSTSALAGALMYWDNTNSTVTTSATSNAKMGVLTAAIANTDTTATIRLNQSF